MFLEFAENSLRRPLGALVLHGLGTDSRTLDPPLKRQWEKQLPAESEARLRALHGTMPPVRECSRRTLHGPASTIFQSPRGRVFSASSPRKIQSGRPRPPNLLGEGPTTAALVEAP